LYRVGKIADKALTTHAFRLRPRVALSLLARAPIGRRSRRREMMCWLKHPG